MSAVDETLVAATQLAAGEPIVVHDDRLCFVAVVAQAITPAVVADFARSARGIMAVAMERAHVDALGLPSMTRGRLGPAMFDYAVSVDASEGSTGISAADRAATIQALRARSWDGRLGAPGHILPMRAAPGGTLERAGVAEACVDLAKVAGAEPVVATCGILDDRGEALAPERLAAHPVYGRLIAISTRLVLAHMSRRPEVAGAEPELFRTAMSALVAGVAAITVRDRSGAPRGMLATSVSSYSDRPPSMLVSAAHTSRTHDPLVAAPSFGMHLLGHDQGDVARALASRSDDKFADLDWAWEGDVPHIRGTLGYLHCARSATFEHHDHTVVIGDVQRIELDDAIPLVFFQRTLGWRLEHRPAA